MKKKRLSWLFTGIGFSLLVAGAVAYGMTKPEVRDAVKPHSVSVAEKADAANDQPVAASHTKDKDLPIGYTGIYQFIDTNPAEEEFMEAVHHMTHQKVKAWPKWGAIHITEERIDELLAILDDAAYDNEKFYRETLTAWENGDFSKVADVHNTIWKWQDGSVGKARGTLSDEDEQAFIKSNFE